MTFNELSNVRLDAISIVGKGANRRRFFLRKSAEDHPEALIELPAEGGLIKAADWAAVYCVVADPTALEDAGMTGEAEVPDRWASADEIRKTAHEFVRGGALINKMHESLAPYGALVESAIALDDFTVGGEQIRKGSWYIAIAPTDEGKAAIDDGTFSGVSIQGSGMRKRVEKAIDHKAADGPLKSLLAHYRKFAHPFTQCVRDNRKRFGPRAENICAGLKDIMLGTQKWRAQFAKAAASSPKADAEWQPLADAAARGWYARGLTDDDAQTVLDVLAEDGPIDKRKVPADERSKLASKGHALADGSYPIADEAALRNAIKAFGRAPEEKRARVKAHIIRRAKALGATESLPDDWQVRKAAKGRRRPGAYDEGKRKRQPAGSSGGGQFASKGGKAGRKRRVAARHAERPKGQRKVAQQQARVARRERTEERKAGRSKGQRRRAQETARTEREARQRTARQGKRETNRKAQRKLKRRGTYGGKVDGDVGPKTRRAIRTFQRREGIEPSGELDRKTRRRLDKRPARR